MINQLNSKELSSKLSQYIDNELNKEDEQALLDQLNTNPSYMESLKKEKSFKDFIKSKIQKKKVSPMLIQSIKDKIRIAPA